MDLVLLTITAISLFLTLAMGLIVFRLLREDRQRSDARVELLTAAVENRPAQLMRARDVAPAAEVPLSTSIATGDLFAVPEVESRWRQRVGVASALALVITLAIYGLTWLTSSPAVKQAAQAPLQLVALQHTLADDTMTISGTVTNPAGGAAVVQPSVVASLFGPDGSLLASQRAALDYATLAPGDESGFEIKIPVKGTVSRYRVGFRRPDDSVIAHVDRRTGGAAAQNTSDARSASWPR